MFRTNPLFRRLHPTRLNLNRLEDRTVPTTFTVTSAADTGLGTLRDAIVAANQNAGADMITFSPSVFLPPHTITLTGGQLLISDALTIQGPSASLLTVSGNSAGRVFDVFSLAKVPLSVTISGLAITGGKFAGAGGGILNDSEHLSLTDCVIYNNETTNGFSGGGVSSTNGGTLTLTRCTVTGNQSTGNGGGIDANTGAIVTLTDSTVSSNTATNQGGGLGIGSSSLLIQASTVSGNLAKNGGGLYFAGVPGAVGLTLRNSTFSGNAASTDGGGVDLVNSGGTLTVQNCTLTANTASVRGGGITRTGGSAAVALSSTILQGNAAPTGPDGYSTGVVQTDTSAVGSTSGMPGFQNLNGNLIGQTIKLGGLASNGGLTKTHALLAGSPCINAGSNPAGLIFDQRGSGSPRALGGIADIGAYEFPVALVVTNANDAGPGSLRQAVADANGLAGTNVITFDPVVFATAQTITLSGGPLNITDAVSIQGPGAALASVSGNQKGGVFEIGNAPAGAAIDLSGLTLTQGSANTGGAVDGTAQQLVLSACVLANNSATSLGGAVSLGGGGTLAATNCVFQNDTAGYSGGAIAVFGGKGAATSLTRCTVSGSTAGQAGGLYAAYSLTLLASTVSGNTATGQSGYGWGGGIEVSNSNAAGGTLVVCDSTISGNTAQTSGGGIMLIYFGGNLTLQNSTVTANSAMTGGGGGIARVSNIGTIVDACESSIVQGNSATLAPDFFSNRTVTAKNCAFGTINGITTFNGAGTNLFGANLKLGPLANNGGPTKTHALLAGSPAIDAGSNPANLANDQRGLPRSVGATDIGAFEVQPAPVTASPVQVNDGAIQRSRVTSLTVTFSESVSFPYGMAAVFQLVRTGPSGQTGSVNLAFAQSGNSVVITFMAGGAVSPDVGGSLSDGRYQLTVVGAEVLGTNGPLDGDGDGMAGGDMVQSLFRLFGDADGNGVVDTLDFAAFRSAFGSANNAAFDFDGGGAVDALDFAAFRQRFGTAV